MKNILLIGGSRGLGEHLARTIPSPKDRLWIVSRTLPPLEPQKYHWIRADLNEKNTAFTIASEMKGIPIDVMIYNAGLWASDFESMTDDAIVDMVHVNLTSLILMMKHLTPHLKESKNARVVLIGSVAGLENAFSSSVAYAATKFGVRGVVYAAQECFRKDNIGFCCISPGSINTDSDTDDGKRIPMSDISDLIKAMLKLSLQSFPKEIIFPLLSEEGV